MFISFKQDTAEIRGNISVIMKALKNQSNSPAMMTSQAQDTPTRTGLKTENSDKRPAIKHTPWPSHRVYEGSGYPKVVVKSPVTL